MKLHCFKRENAYFLEPEFSSRLKSISPHYKSGNYRGNHCKPYVVHLSILSLLLHFSKRCELGFNQELNQPRTQPPDRICVVLPKFLKKETKYYQMDNTRTSMNYFSQ